MLLGLLTKEQGKKLLDNFFDWIENMVEDSENKFDDAVVLPLVNKARELLDVPDDD